MEYLLSVPLKKGSEVDLQKPLKNLIGNLYSTPTSPIDCTTSINELNKLRAAALMRQNDRSEAGLEALYRYYDQISGMELKIPQHEVQVSFKWKDAFDKGSLFGGKVSLTVASLGYEKVCILFNIGAMQSQLGCNSRVSDSDEELKAAAKMFQSAAGIFAYIRTAGSVFGGLEPTPDLSAAALTVLSNLMLAQAQEIFVHKAIQDKMKDAIISKLAMQAEDLYAETLHAMQKENKVFWDKEWLSVITGKQAGFVGLANYFQSNVCASKKQIGEQIARLNLCVEQLKQAQSRSGIQNLLADYATKAQRALTEAKKDNDFIYHERIPDSLPSVEKVASARIAKLTPIPDRFLPGRELFDNLVPVAVHQAMASCDMRKAEMTNSKLANLREASQVLNSILVSLNLPAALEDQSSGNSVPQSLLDKSRSVIAEGGIANLQTRINELPELVQRNKEILDETERLVREEEESDAQLRTQLKEKWTRTPSDKLNSTFKQNGEKYRTILKNALDADEVVKGKLARNREAMEVLSGGDSALASRLPKDSAGVRGTGSLAARDNLKGLMESVERLKFDRDALETRIKTLSFDLRTPFLKALAQDGAINESALSMEILGSGFVELDHAIKESLETQERLIVEIQRNSEEYFGHGHGTDGVDGNSREAIMRQLAEGYDAFKDLRSNVTEGTKFYNDLTQLLLSFQNKVSDFCFARKTEKEELLKDVTRLASASTPQQPPPRPPQPIIPTTPYTTAAPIAPAAPVAAPAPPQSFNPPQMNPIFAGAPPPTQHYATLPYPGQPAMYGGMPMPYQIQTTPYPYVPVYNPYATLPAMGHPHQQHHQQQAYPYPVQPTTFAYVPQYGHQQPPPAAPQ